MKNIQINLHIFPIFLMTAVLCVGAYGQSGAGSSSNGALYQMQSGQWSPLGISVPSTIVDVQAFRGSYIGKSRDNSFFQYDVTSAAWRPFTMSLPAGTVELKSTLSLFGSDEELLARTGSQTLFFSQGSAWQQAKLNCLSGTVNIGVGNGLFALTQANDLYVMLDTAWQREMSVPATAVAVTFFDNTVVIALSDGSWQKIDIPTTRFVAAAFPSATGVKEAFVSSGNLIIWK